MANNSDSFSSSLAAKTLKANDTRFLTTIFLKPKSENEREQFISQSLHFISTISESDLSLINASTWSHLFNLIFPIVDLQPKQAVRYPPKTKVLSARLMTQIPLTKKENKDDLILKIAQNAKQDNDIRYILVEGLLKKDQPSKNVVNYFKRLIRMPRPSDSAALAQVLNQMYDQKEKTQILISFLDYLPKIPENSRLYWLSNYSGISTTSQQDRRILNSFSKASSDTTREALIEFIKIKDLKDDQSKKILTALITETKNPTLKKNAELLLAR
ncbi:MAG: hypothetical protein B7Y39_10980 [Bdellovibrio sp. 28-41-41]|nr:MAG: hypothetical protein B7Y39_10980 [Bdellovibrio sp. 28-41-41]